MAQPQSPNAPELAATDARQGRKGRDVFVVLVISVALAVVALVAVWIYRAPQLAASEINNAKRPALSQTFHAPPSQPIQSAAPPS
jgi:hypothetical protein